MPPLSTNTAHAGDDRLLCATGVKSQLPPQNPNRSMNSLSAPPSPSRIFKRMNSKPSAMPLMLLRRSSSAPGSSTRGKHRTAAYAGATPVRKDGSSVKSCFRDMPSQECSVTSLESDDLTPPHRLHKVSFSRVSVREYSLECGDNPSVSSGAPITLGWAYNKKGSLDIESYEADRTRLRRTECRRLSADQREHLLSTVGGHSHRQILTAQFETQMANQERLQTINNLGGLGRTKYVGPRERVEMLKESAARKIERACKGTTSAKEQQKLWVEAQVSRQNKP